MVAENITVQFRDLSATPSYIASMAPFEVKQLTAANVVASNGNYSLQDVNPAEWASGDPAPNATSGTAPNIISVWCGGAGDRARHRLYCRGGGHGDAANNGLFYFDFSGDAQWGGSVLQDISAVADVPVGTGAYPEYNDGRPGAVHSYDGQGVYSAANKFITSMGSLYQNGGLLGGTWVLDMNSNQWTECPDIPIPSGNGWVGTLTVNESAGKAFATIRGNSSTGAFFDFSDNTWSAKGVANIDANGSLGYLVSAVNEATGEILMMREGEAWVSSIDWSAETVSMQSATISGYTPTQAASLMWDSARGSIWAFGGTGGDFNTIYEITGSGTSRTATAHTLTGDTINLQTPYNGLFNNAVLMPDYRAFGFVTHSQEAPYIMRLP